MFEKIVFVGNLGQDPELRYTPSGAAVTTISVATNRRFTDSAGQDRNEVKWFRVSVWGKQAEACAEYLSKGRQVLVEGRLIGDENGNPRIWTGNDGVARTSFEVNAQTVRFLGSNPNGPPPVEEQLPLDEEGIPY